MTNYRRYRVPGGTYFFRVNLEDRRSFLLVAEIEHLRSAVRKTLAKSPLHIDGWVAAGMYAESWAAHEAEPAIAGERLAY